MRKYIAFLLVWFCSGLTMSAYQTGNKALGIGFSLLSLLYWAILGKTDRKKKTPTGFTNPSSVIDLIFIDDDLQG